MTPRRQWATDNPHDGRTVAPSLTLHRATEKTDLETLAKLYDMYDRDRGRLERMSRPLRNGKPNPLKGQVERKVWNAALAITAMSGTTEHNEGGRLFPYDCEPVAWGDDF